MHDIPGFLEKEVYYKDSDQLKIDVIEVSKNNLFKIERVYFLTTNEHSHISGNHAHLNQEQIFILIKGSAEIKLINLKKTKYVFTIKTRGLYVPSAHWIELNLAPDSVVLCLASKSYIDLKSIHSLEEFMLLASK